MWLIDLKAVWNEIVMFLMSRLKGDAAALFLECQDIVTWSAFKELLNQHFGNRHSVLCNIEYESLKINSGECFLGFCNRI